MHKVGTQGRRVPLGNSLSLGSSTKHLVALTSLSHTAKLAQNGSSHLEGYGENLFSSPSVCCFAGRGDL